MEKPMGKRRNAWILGVIILAVFFSTLSGPTARAADMIKIGLLQEPKTLNIWRASDRWSRKVLGQIYNPLFIREPENQQPIPWLAADHPVYDEATLTYTLKLRKAKWSDGSAFTSEDVVFTANTIKALKVPRYNSRWRFVEKVEAVDPQTVRFVLKEPKAIFLSRSLTGTPMIQKKEWENVLKEAEKEEKPLSYLLNYKIEKPVGTGPFVLKEWKQGAYLYLQKNKHFFGKGEKMQGLELGPFIDGIIFKVYGNTDAAILGLKKGDMDMFWWGLQPGYLEDLQTDANIDIYVNERSALYYLGFNNRKKPFSDVHFRRAVAFLVDRDFIMLRVLQGYGNKMNSIVPPGNTYWLCPDEPDHAKVYVRGERVKKAFEILREAGYTWETPPVSGDGEVTEGEGLKQPDGTPVADFSILTPPADYDPNRAMAGLMIQEWLRKVGMPASAKPMGFSSLLQQVKTRHEFDMFVLGYGSLSLDPDYLRAFFHSSQDKPRGWNMGGYRNPDYDQLAEKQAGTMDAGKRREIIWEMQRVLMHDVPYLPLYNPKMVEGVRNDRFGGWVQMVEGIGNTWSFCTITPK